MAGKPELMSVEVAYGRPDEQALVSVQLPHGATAREAIQHSGLLERFPEIDLEKSRVGIFGRITTLDARLHGRDRVEIYRPLVADPREVRKRRAAQGKGMRKGHSA
jgi:hypothetical protein